jgi:hypothetical protein
MCSGRSDTPSRVPGFPIRISTDQSLVGSSPWLFAATHVLHRCQTPRHPPLALCSLEEQRCSCSLCSSQGAQTRAHAAPSPETRMPAQPLGHRRRSLEVKEDRSLKTEERTVVRPGLGRREENTYHRRRRRGPDRARLQLGVVPACAGTLTP